MSDNENRQSKTERAPTLNIPAGNSPISPESNQPVPKDEKLSGNWFQDVWTATKRIQPVEDLQNLGKIPCVRSSLLYGIGTGVGLGAVRFLGSGRPGSAANWAVFTFCVVSIASWEVCQKQRRDELATQRMIQERFPHRHISNLKKRGEEFEPPNESK